MVIALSKRELTQRRRDAEDAEKISSKPKQAHRARLILAVIPAQAGIHIPQRFLDPGLRRDDRKSFEARQSSRTEMLFIFLCAFAPLR
jgi:hypothetical protein